MPILTPSTVLLAAVTMSIPNWQLPDPINKIRAVVICRKCHSPIGALRIHEGSSADKADCKGKICQTVCTTISTRLGQYSQRWHHSSVRQQAVGCCSESWQVGANSFVLGPSLVQYRSFIDGGKTMTEK